MCVCKAAGKKGGGSGGGVGGGGGGGRRLFVGYNCYGDRKKNLPKAKKLRNIQD